MRKELDLKLDMGRKTKGAPTKQMWKKKLVYLQFYASLVENSLD